MRWTNIFLQGKCTPQKCAARCLHIPRTIGAERSLGKRHIPAMWDEKKTCKMIGQMVAPVPMSLRASRILLSSNVDEARGSEPSMGLLQALHRGVLERPTTRRHLAKMLDAGKTGEISCRSACACRASQNGGIVKRNTSGAYASCSKAWQGSFW